MKSYLRGIRAALGQKVVVLDYPWIAKTRTDDSYPGHAAIEALLKQDQHRYELILQYIISLFDQIALIPATSQDKETVYWYNKYLPGLDVVALYAITTMLNPDRIIEIGSGHSTAVMRKAIRDGHLQSEIVCIDPNPRRELSALADQHIKFSLESLTDFELFSALSPGDIVFFDGSHMALPNTDVTVFFMEILPLIPPGVYVQIHDIYLPFDYPQEMVLRGYNEQYILAQALMYSRDKFEIVFPAFWIASQSESMEFLARNLWSRLSFRDIETHGGSFWIKILR